MNIARFSSFTAASLAGLALNAATYYVDPRPGFGSDDFDGTAEVWEGGESKVGPKRTLAGIMANVPANSTVIALPGVYDEGVSNPEAIDTGTTLTRVIVPNNVTLKSRDGAEKTFIIGAESTAPGRNPTYGLGTNAVRCARVTGNYGRLEGFTLCGGRTSNVGDDGNKSGGAIVGSGPVVDCIISNNVATYRGGGGYYANFYRCRFLTGNHCLTTAGKPVVGGTWYHCYFTGGKPYFGTGYNCTFGPSSFPHGCSSGVYNSIIVDGGGDSSNGTWLHSCLITTTLDASKGQNWDEKCVFTNLTALALGSDGRLGRGSCAIDTADEVVFTNTVSAKWRDFDCDHTSRIKNGHLDYGAFEYDWCDDYASRLSPMGVVAVTNASSLVTASPTGVVLTAGTSLDAVLRPFNDAATTFEIQARVTGSGTLSVYLEGAVEPTYAITSADGLAVRQIPITANTGCRFAYTGADGQADLFDFSNVSYARILAPQKGVSVEGGTLGTNYVAAGGSLTVTVKRAYDSTVACLGVEVNGVFYGFDDYPAGLPLTVTDADRTSSVSVVAVYKEGLQDWYVDDDGDDDNCGLYTNQAFKTLKKALGNPLRLTGETVYALPGTYDELECTEGGGTTPARAFVPEGAILKSLEGPEKTVIVGKRADTASGCGEGAVRCLYMKKDTRVEGFTLCGGAVDKWEYDASEYFRHCSGGAAYCESSATALIVGCVVSNNAAYCGGAFYSGHVVRCRVYRNGGLLGTDIFSGTQCFSTYFSNQNGYNIYSACKVDNCTFANGGGKGPRNGCKLYNSLFLNSAFMDDCNCTFENCRMVAVPGGSTYDPADVHSVDELGIDADYRPLSGSAMIDASDMVRYVTATSSLAGVADVDFAGGQRVYNRTADIGCGEFDWRPAFAKKLGGRAVSIEAMSPNVTTNVVSGLDLGAGDAVALKVVQKVSGKASLAVDAADGTVAVTADGAPVAGEAGVYTYAVQPGVSKVRVAFDGGTTAVLHDVKGTKTGLTLIIR